MEQVFTMEIFQFPLIHAKLLYDIIVTGIEGGLLVGLAFYLHEGCCTCDRSMKLLKNYEAKWTWIVMGVLLSIFGRRFRWDFTALYD